MSTDYLNWDSFRSLGHMIESGTQIKKQIGP